MFVVTAFVILFADLVGLTAPIDRWILDLRSSLVRYAPTGDVVLVDIDPKSLAEVGVWPWPRDIHAGLVQAANALGADRIAFDIDFSARTSPDRDKAFAEALSASSAETFLAAFVQAPSTDPDASAVSLPIDTLLSVSWPAGVNLPLDPDGRARTFATRVETSSETIISMPSLLAGREIVDDLIGINHSIDANFLPRISYVDLLHGRVDRAQVAGKTLIVGATALELRDLFQVPIRGIVSGSTVIALATETLLQNREIRPVNWSLVAIPLLLGLQLAAHRRWRTGPLLTGLLATVVLMEASAFLLHHQAGLSLSTSGPVIALSAFSLMAMLREFSLSRLLAAVSLAEAGSARRVLDRVVEMGFDGIVILDGQDRIVRANPAALRMPLRPAGGPMQNLADLPRGVQTAVREARLRDGTVHARAAATDLIIDGLGADVPPSTLELSVVLLDVEVTSEVSASREWAGHVCLTFRDVTEARQSQGMLRTLALQDPLTALGNRRCLEGTLAKAREERHSTTALLLFDLDRFKSVNDTLGHSVGDEVLVEVGRRATSVVGRAGTIARMGGDEFAVLLPGFGVEAAERTSRELIAAMVEPFAVDGHRVSIGASVGIAVAKGDELDADRIVRQADLALNAAKENTGDRRIVVFQTEMEQARLQRLELETDLVRAFEEGAFELAYQPQVSLPEGRIIGAEALLRWKHPVRGYVSPALFIPVAEEMGLIHALGEWVMGQACRDAAQWPVPISLAVNVASIQFEAGDLVQVVDRALSTTGLPPSRLELEITESAFVRESDHLAAQFRALTQRGIKFALDDFGTGYSSLGYLHRFPISKIKIDRQFVTGLPEASGALAIVRSIIALSHGLSIRTIAEGVETSGEIECLHMLGCREVQGYAFHRPMPDANLYDLLSQALRPEPASRIASSTR